MEGQSWTLSDTGADLADVDQFQTDLLSEVKCRDPRRILHESHNRKLRPLHALDLDPRVAAFRPVRGIGFFRDNSFEPQLARVCEQARPLRHKMVGVQDGARYSRLV